MDLKEIRAWLKENEGEKDVIAFMEEFKTPITAETVQPYLETTDGTKLLQPLMDKRVSEALKTYKENHYEKDVKSAVASEMLRINPQETPEQKRLREVEEELKKEKENRLRDNLRRQIVEESARENVPSWWVDVFNGNSIEEAKVFIGKVKKHNADLADKVKNELIATGFKPGTGDSKNGNTSADLSKLSREDMIQLEMEGKLDSIISN